MAKNSTIEISPDLKSLYRDTAEKLTGSDRRQFMAQLVKQWGRGGYTFAEKELGWNRRTIRKGMIELAHGLSIADSFRLRGRHPIEQNLPHLLSDIGSLIDHDSQTDPSFGSSKLYTRISNELNLFFVSSKLTADCIVDLLENWCCGGDNTLQYKI